MCTGFGGKTWGEKATFEDPGIDARIIRRWVFREWEGMGGGSMNWNDPAQDRDKWRALVNAVMNLRVPWKAEHFLTSWEPFSFSRRTLSHGESKIVGAWKLIIYSPLVPNIRKDCKCTSASLIGLCSPRNLWYGVCLINLKLPFIPSRNNLLSIITTLWG